jgi:hypothetical protein
MKDKLTIEEVFGILPVDQDEVEIDRTNDWGSIRDPNWTSPLKKFNLGLQNSKETILSNMIAKKTNNNSICLSDFLDYMTSTQSILFDFMYKIIDRILTKE